MATLLGRSICPDFIRLFQVNDFSDTAQSFTVAYRLLFRIVLPCLKKMYGNGATSRHKPPSKNDAHWYPSFSYI